MTNERNKIITIMYHHIIRIYKDISNISYIHTSILFLLICATFTPLITLVSETAICSANDKICSHVN